MSTLFPNPEVLTPLEPDHLGRAEVFGEGDTAIRAERYLLEGDYRPHDHRFLELVLVLSGEGTQLSLQGEHRLEAGSALVLRPGVWHAYRACHALEVLNAYVGVEVLHRELAWVAQDPLLGRLVWTLPRSLDRQGVLQGRLEGEALRTCRDAWNALEQCSNPAERTERTERAERLAYLLLLLTPLARSLPPRATGEPDPSALPVSVRHCIEAFETDPARPWTLEHLARSTGQSASHLSRLFTRATGVPPLAYLNRWRLEQAALQLVQGGQAIAQIGADLGWLDANLFTRRFKAHHGLTPSAFRTRYR